MKCPRLYPLQILGRKWSYLLLRNLTHPMSFSMLRRELRYLTNTTLSREIKYLQGEGLMENEQGLYYRTEEGNGLMRAFEDLKVWGEEATGRSCPESLRCSQCALYEECVTVY